MDNFATALNDSWFIIVGIALMNLLSPAPLFLSLFLCYNLIERYYGEYSDNVLSSHYYHKIAEIANTFRVCEQQSYEKL